MSVRQPAIRILDLQTVNQIAAGEVVERPASIVKELVENAIDAGAASIRIGVETEEGTVRRIEVADDGAGMTPADARRAFLPHATSKIATIDDLHRCTTLGFRGEALASIAAVSQVTLITKERAGGSLAGTRVVMRGGDLVEEGETGAPEGTTVVVEDLFYNTPARRKFQKSLPVELAHIAGFVEGLALSHPGIAFRLLHNSQERITTFPSADLLDTIGHLYGAEIASSLLPVRADHRSVRIRGYTARPAFSRQNPSQITIAINGRMVASTPIVRAVREGYGTLLPKGRYPVAFIDLFIDTSLVDVNVHPTKREVRLSHEREILEAVRDAVRRTLSKNDLVPGREPSSEDQPVDMGLTRDQAQATSLPPEVAEPSLEGYRTTDRQLRQTELALEREQNLLPPMEVIGQVGAGYILASTREGDLFIVDQHAAHERILYEQVSRERDASLAMQDLIEPLVLRLTPRETAALRSALPALEEEGFRIEPFGRDTYAVTAVPVVLGRCEEPAAIHEAIADLLHDETHETVGTRERVTRIVACRGALKAGTVVTRDQCRRLIEQLGRTETPYTCPHGRPTVIRFSKAQLDVLFKRT